MKVTLNQLACDILAIRKFEEFVLKLFSEGLLNGTTHAYIGQEAVAASIFSQLSQQDWVFSNHRCHGHYLLHQRDPVGLLAELMGRSAGVCGGVGGSQHLHRGRFFSNGVQGGTVPALLGLTWAARHRGEQSAIGVVFLGDGTLGQGQVYECFNLASLWQLPVLFVLEHNEYSQSTPSRLQIAGDVAKRAEAFDIPVYHMESNWVLDCLPPAEQATNYVRQERRPAMLFCKTFRLCSHSRSDDGRSAAEVEARRDQDPVVLLKAHMDCREIESAIDQELEQTFQLASKSPPASQWALDEIDLPAAAAPVAGEPQRVVNRLNQVFHQILENSPEVVVVGMDILDPYGGAFKVEKGLSTQFPKQVLPTPISETSLAGLCGGMALNGVRPVLQIMFGDFLTLATDPIINYICKYRGMYNNQVRCPVVIRAAMGAGRGYGPTHSQSLEKHFMGIPDLRIVAINAIHDAGQLLKSAIADEAPVLFIENKLLYPRKQQPVVAESWGHFTVRSTDSAYPCSTFSPNDFRFSDCILAVYGGLAELALEASETLITEHDLAVEVVLFTKVSPVEAGPVESALRRASGRLITLEESSVTGGWGSELVAKCSEGGALRASRRIGALECVIPSARQLEEQVIPSAQQVVAAIRQFLTK
jgi:2-oxoisovalerate dehydrogenase E1 component